MSSIPKEDGHTKSTENGVSQREFRHHKWTIETHKSHILESKCKEPEVCSAQSDLNEKCSHCKFNNNLEISHLPDMTFARNILRVYHDDGFGIEFKPLDALKEVRKRCEEKVHASEEWIKLREQHSEAQLINQNFDWTFTTEYVGTLLPGECKAQIPSDHKPEMRRLNKIERLPSSNKEDDLKIQVQPSKLSINLDKLRVREEILFFDEIVLYEDELADNGVSKLDVRIRVMPDKLYMLMRFYLRVDRIKVKVYDTRIYFEEGNNYFERDITRHEADLQQTHPAALGDLQNPDELCKRIKPQTVIHERLVFPTTSH